MRYLVLPYRQGSKSAKALATALGGRVMRLQGSTARLQGATMVNWGNTTVNPGAVSFTLLNPVERIKPASNKLLFFRRMREAGHNNLIPEFWENQQDIPDEAFPIVCRTVLAGHSGDGIVIAADRGHLVPASLYVRYVKKSQEYRVHVGRKRHDITADPFIGPEYDYEIIAVQRKARRYDVTNPNWQVRNHANGFIYSREGFTAPVSVLVAAKMALDVSGLDFGAVDVIWNQQQDRPYVLEINTAPGLEGQTIADYADFFRGL